MCTFECIQQDFNSTHSGLCTFTPQKLIHSTKDNLVFYIITCSLGFCFSLLFLLLLSSKYIIGTLSYIYFHDLRANLLLFASAIVSLISINIYWNLFRCVMKLIKKQDRNYVPNKLVLWIIKLHWTLVIKTYKILESVSSFHDQVSQVSGDFRGELTRFCLVLLGFLRVGCDNHVLSVNWS